MGISALKKLLLKFYLFYFLTVQCEGISPNLNRSVYHSMPALYAMDDFDDCDFEPLGYCVVDLKLFSNSQSELMNIIQNYSSDSIKHYDRTLIHRAICLSKTCKNHYIYKSNKTPDLWPTLEACINQSVWEGYGLQAEMKALHYCEHGDSRVDLDAYDIAVATVYATIFLLTALGTWYDFYQSRNHRSKGNEYLLAFSLKRNWAKLVAPAGNGPHPRFKRLKVINGMRSMTMYCVILSHTIMTLAITYLANPQYVEEAYDNYFTHILFNGTLVLSTFFIISSFLLAYNLQITSEKQQLSWTHIPRGMLLRWFRLTPPYALVIATISSWMRHFGSGPLWRLLVLSETQACRQSWWANVFYFNNYYYKMCFPISWYLSAEFHLFCAGLTLLIAVQRTSRRVIALSFLFILSLMIIAAVTYFQDLDPVTLHSPEAYRTYYRYERTFQNSYIPSHTNLTAYLLGMAAGLLTYCWQSSNFNATKFKRYRWVVWIQFPLGLALIMSGVFFYSNAKPPMLVRVLYATVHKPLFQIMVLIVMLACIFKLESVYRPILEWRGWTWLSRVSYSVFLMHPLYLRAYIGTQRSLVHLSEYHVSILQLATVSFSLMSGAILWLTVDAPVSTVIRIFMTKSGPGLEDPQTNTTALNLLLPRPESTNTSSIQVATKSNV